MNLLPAAKKPPFAAKVSLIIEFLIELLNITSL